MEEIGRNEPLKNLHEGLTLTESVLAKVFSRHGLAKITPEVPLYPAETQSILSQGRWQQLLGSFMFQAFLW